ncbi:GDSL-type esterase/lipase family protein [Streptomyces virginiae]|uniref:GDSL-type esterase/lipase family protein n=1 Tax=Streptomyces virginiae TaxID=1961 RepID=UPI00368CFB6D
MSSSRTKQQDIQSLRYELAPQFEEYDAFRPHLNRHTGFSAAPNISSRSLSTDQNGFRRTPTRGDGVDVDTQNPPASVDCVVLGGSTVFGVGATSDAMTLVGQAAHQRGERWLNLGIRGASSTQEVQALLPFALTAQRVVVCSGVNNLIISLQTDDGHRDVYQPLYYDKAFDLVASMPLVDVATLVKEGEPVRANLRRRSAPPPPSPVTQEQGSFTLWERMLRAAARQLRDLELIVRLVGSPDKVLFCAQPFADRTDRGDIAQERSLIGIYDTRQGPVWQDASRFAAARWKDYVGLLSKGCTSLGVSFVDLPAADFEGWSFLDRVHLTDHGYRQVASRICEAIA